MANQTSSFVGYKFGVLPQVLPFTFFVPVSPEFVGDFCCLLCIVSTSRDGVSELALPGYIYIYIYIYMCVCVCVCVCIYTLIFQNIQFIIPLPLPVECYVSSECFIVSVTQEVEWSETTFHQTHVIVDIVRKWKHFIIIDGVMLNCVLF